MANVLQSNQANGGQPAARPVRKTGTGYTNLQSLLGANNASQLGNTLSQNVANNVNKTVGNIQGAENQFKQGTQQEQGRISGLQTNAQNALNQIVNAPSTASYSVDANGNPVQSLVNNQDVQNYSGYLGAKYQGPNDLSNSANLQNQQATSGQYAKLLGSQPGQQQLLRTFVNNPNYTNAQQSLDSLLLGKQDIQSGLKNARAQALQKLSSNNVSDLSNQAQQQARQQQASLGQQQQGLQTNTQGAATNINQALSDRLKQLTDQSSAQNAVYGQLAQNNFGAVDANGQSILTPQQKSVAEAYLKNNVENPQDFFQYSGPQNLSQSGVASQQQAAQLAALGQLMNNPNLNLGPNVGNAQAGNLNIGDLVGNAQQRVEGLQQGDINNLISTLSGGGKISPVQTASDVQYQLQGGSQQLDPSLRGALNVLGTQAHFTPGTFQSLNAKNTSTPYSSDFQRIQDALNQYYGLNGLATNASNNQGSKQ